MQASINHSVYCCMDLSAILQRREIQLFVSQELIHWIIYEKKKQKKHALCNCYNNETFAHYNMQFCDAFLEKHIWRPIMLYACVNLCMHMSVRWGISPWNIAELSTCTASVSVARARVCVCVCVCICDLLSRGIYAKPAAVFPYAPSYCCLRSTWPGLAPVLACVVTPGYSNTQSHHHPIPYAEAGKHILSFWLLCSCCSLEEVKGGLAKHCPNLDVHQLSGIGLCQDCTSKCFVS